jgi:hypothetical protein
MMVMERSPTEVAPRGTPSRAKLMIYPASATHMSLSRAEILVIKQLLISNLVNAT